MISSARARVIVIRPLNRLNAPIREIVEKSKTLARLAGNHPTAITLVSMSDPCHSRKPKLNAKTAKLRANPTENISGRPA